VDGRAMRRCVGRDAFRIWPNSPRAGRPASSSSSSSSNSSLSPGDPSPHRIFSSRSLSLSCLDWMEPIIRLGRAAGWAAACFPFGIVNSIGGGAGGLDSILTCQGGRQVPAIAAAWNCGLSSAPWRAFQLPSGDELAFPLRLCNAVVRVCA
jgi:hypothetical protein